MAAVSISLSQNMASAIMQQLASPDRDTIADDFQLFFGAAFGFALNHGANNTASNTANGLVLAYADGASSTISDVAAGADGKTTASGFTYQQPGLFNMHLGGSFSYNYNLLGGALSLLNSDANLTSGSFKTTYASTDPNYDPLLGNGTISFQGQVHSAAGSDFSGVITSITAAGEHVLASGEATGTFNVSGNGLKVGALQASPDVSGILNGYHEHFDDGSSVTIDNAQIAVASATTIDDSLVLNGANFAGNDVFTITLPSNLSTPWAINAGAGNDKIILNGGSVVVDGGAGADTVALSGTQASYTITNSGSGSFTVRAADGATATLANVERLQFSDTAVAYDTDGAAGQIYRLYQAAFDRTADTGGLGFWIKAMDNGLSLHDVAYGFTQSAEFHAIFGQSPSNANIVNHLYQNALHRTGEASGVAFWLNLLDTHQLSIADVMIGFSESPESHAGVASVIGNGIIYTSYG